MFGFQWNNVNYILYYFCYILFFITLNVKYVYLHMFGVTLSQVVLDI